LFEEQAMHINSTTHEHGTSAKVYSYEADFDVGADAITWKASVRQGGVQLDPISGSIPVTSPGLAAFAEQAVRDEIVKRIDHLDDTRHGLHG
jgi:hypothetical protein